jgi:enoyl-CoA hydratase/carnithine racemase
MAMSSLLAKVTGKAMMYIVYSTAMMDAARAREIGLVSEVVAKAGLDKAVERLCASIAQAPLPAVLAVKEYASHAPAMGLHGAIEYARSLHATINSSSELKPAKK